MLILGCLVFLAISSYSKPISSKWDTNNLTYRTSKYSKYSKKLDKDVVDEEINKAFAVWSDVADLTFTLNNKGSSVHIDIRFVYLVSADIKI